MSRLTELIKYYEEYVSNLAEGWDVTTRHMECGEIRQYREHCQMVDDTLNSLKELQHYKDLEEQGRLIEIVRCKECKWFKPDQAQGKDLGVCGIHGTIYGKMDFCNKGKLAELKGTGE